MAVVVPRIHAARDEAAHGVDVTGAHRGE
jgi:hypothetical protein